MAHPTSDLAIPAILHGDARSLPLPDESVDLIVTSPPYFALRSYKDGGEHYDGQIGSEATPADFIAALIDCTREMVRVLKPTGSIFVNLGDKYDHRRKSLRLLPERYRIAATDELGLVARAVIIWSKPNGLPESVTDRVRRSHEDWVHLTRSPHYFCAGDAIREPASERTLREQHLDGQIGSAYRNRQNKEGGSAGSSSRGNPSGRLPGSVWDIACQPFKAPPLIGVEHFAAFPMEWPRRLILGWSPPTGVVLDPFGGTGTTALVATTLGRQGISVDLSVDYCRLATWRCSDPRQRQLATVAKVRPAREVAEPEPLDLSTAPLEPLDPILTAIADADDRDALIAIWRASKDAWTDEYQIAVKARLADVEVAA